MIISKLIIAMMTTISIPTFASDSSNLSSEVHSSRPPIQRHPHDFWFERRAERDRQQAIAKQRDTLYQIERRDLAENSLKLFQSIGNGDDVKGIEVILAGRAQALMSSFGHLILRFVQNEQNPFEDVTIQFIADVDQPTVDYRRGMFGGYKVMIASQKLSEVLIGYGQEEGRTLQRFILPSTPELRQRLVTLIRHKMENPGTSGNYYFTANNCSSALIKTLTAAGFLTAIKGSAHTIPAQIQLALRDNFLSYLPPLKMVNVPKMMQSISSELFSLDSQALKLPANEAKLRQKFSQLDTLTLYRIYLTLTSKLSSVNRADLIQMIRSRNAPRPSLEEVYGINKIPNALYDRCEQDCRQKDLLHPWSFEEIQKQCGFTRAELRVLEKKSQMGDLSQTWPDRAWFFDGFNALCNPN